jgi:hypothetical protein
VQSVLDDSIDWMLTNHLGTTDAGGHATARRETGVGGSTRGNCTLELNDRRV